MQGREFLGRGLKFPLQVDPKTGKLAMTEGEDDIREAIGIILRTTVGERVMRPDFGSNVMDYLFQPANGGVLHGLEHDVRECLFDQEQRIEDIEVQCRESNELPGGIIVEVSYTVSSTNSRYNHVYPFYLTEGEEGGGAG
ncbi:MAG: GPW/gp25 family protein [Oscillospiraceae bacterium]|nr:GPW/gp25 family protein [Oscillospiraceae bacterium]